MNILGLIDISVWILIPLGLFVAYYIYMTWHFNIFKSLNIKGPEPQFPYGTWKDFFSNEMGLWKSQLDWVRKYGKCFGSFMGRKPQLVISDDKMLREIMVKQFHNFTNKPDFGSRDEITDHILLFMRDDDWRRVRTTITPSFTSGKLKHMTQSIQACADLMIKFIEARLEKSEEIELKGVAGGFTMDVISRVGFGLEIDSQSDPKNPFVVMGRKGFSFSENSIVIRALIFTPFLLPLLGLLKMSFLPKDVKAFFTKIIEKAISVRKEGDEKKTTDLLQLMINAGERQTSELDVETIKQEVEQHGDKFDHAHISKTGMSKPEIISQGLLLFLAGYDTTASGISLLLYQLTVNPECQEKIYKEITSVVGQQEKIDYALTNKMPYLEMCVEESLRMYPPIIITERETRNNTTVCGVSIPKGVDISIPISAIHYDPEVYPDPEKFDPERFTPENKAGRSPFAWLPFGYGPRVCIGMRLALLEIKITVTELIRKYKFETCPRTQIPLKFKKTGILSPKEGIWVKATRRN